MYDIEGHSLQSKHPMLAGEHEIQRSDRAEEFIEPFISMSHILSRLESKQKTNSNIDSSWTGLGFTTLFFLHIILYAEWAKFVTPFSTSCRTDSSGPDFSLRFFFFYKGFISYLYVNEQLMWCAVL